MCKGAAAELTPHKLAPFHFAIPIPHFNNHYECSFLPMSTICNAHNLATRLSLPGSMQHSRNSQGESRAARLNILHGIIYRFVISYMYTHTQVHKSYRVAHWRIWFVCLLVNSPPFLIITLFYITLLNSLADGQLGGTSGANLPMKSSVRLLQVIYHTLIVQPTSIKPKIPKTRWCFHSTLFLTPGWEELFEIGKKLLRQRLQ